MGKNSQSSVEKIKALLADAEEDTLREVREHIDQQLPTEPEPEAPAGAYNVADGTPLPVATDIDPAAEAEKADKANHEQIEHLADAGNTGDNSDK